MKILAEFFVKDEAGTKAKSIEITHEDIKEYIQGVIEKEYKGEVSIDRLNILIDLK